MFKEICNRFFFVLDWNFNSVKMHEEFYYFCIHMQMHCAHLLHRIWSSIFNVWFFNFFFDYSITFAITNAIAGKKPNASTTSIWTMLHCTLRFWSGKSWWIGIQSKQHYFTLNNVQNLYSKSLGIDFIRQKCPLFPIFCTWDIFWEIHIFFSFKKRISFGKI